MASKIKVQPVLRHPFFGDKKFQLIQTCHNRQDHRHRHSANFRYVHFSLVFWPPAQATKSTSLTHPDFETTDLSPAHISPSKKTEPPITSNIFSKTGEWAKRSGCGWDQKLQTGPHQEDRIFDDFNVWIDRRCWEMKIHKLEGKNGQERTQKQTKNH